MKAEIVATNRPEVPATQPWVASGFMWRIVEGDLCDPVADPDGWYGDEPPLVLLRKTNFRTWFVAFKWPLIGRCFYAGGKLYGLDGAPAYRRFVPEIDCQPGSTAICFSLRLFAKL